MKKCTVRCSWLNFQVEGNESSLLSCQEEQNGAGKNLGREITFRKTRVFRQRLNNGCKKYEFD